MSGLGGGGVGLVVMTTKIKADKNRDFVTLKLGCWASCNSKVNFS